MSTVADIIKNVKYDLRNFGQIDFDPDQLIHYLNRCIEILDQKLVQFNSDQTLTEVAATISQGLDYVSEPTNCLEVREVWILQDRKQQVDQQELYYRRQFKKWIDTSGDSITSGLAYKTISQNTLDFTTVGAANNDAGTYWLSTGAGTLGSGDSVWRYQMQQPQYWSYVKNQIQFEAASDTDHTCKIIYDKKSDALTSTSSTMPYNGVYDQSISEVLVNMLVNKKYKEGNELDASYMALFDQIASQDMVNRKFWRKQYKLDF